MAALAPQPAVAPLVRRIPILKPLSVASSVAGESDRPNADAPAKQGASHSCGVVRDVRWHGWDLESPIIYGPYSRLTTSSFQTFFLRTNVDPSATIQQAVRAMVDAEPMMKPRTAATLEEMYRASVALRRFQSWLFGGFSGAALAVVGVGILGLLAMSAARRTREVGIRCALGATPRSVTAQMIREQLPQLPPD